MGKKAKIIVVLEGGLIEGVYSNDKVECLTVEYDDDDHEPSAVKDMEGHLCYADICKADPYPELKQEFRHFKKELHGE